MPVKWVYITTLPRVRVNFALKPKNSVRVIESLKPKSRIRATTFLKPIKNLRDLISNIR